MRQRSKGGVDGVEEEQKNQNEFGGRQVEDTEKILLAEKTGR